MPMRKELDGVCFLLEGNSTFLMDFLDLQIRLGNKIGWSENLLTGDREENQCSGDESVTWKRRCNEVLPNVTKNSQAN